MSKAAPGASAPTPTRRIGLTSLYHTSNAPASGFSIVIKHKICKNAPISGIFLLTLPLIGAIIFHVRTPTAAITKEELQMTKSFTMTSKALAWNKVNEIFPTDYERDDASSERAGYPVYRSTADGHWYDYI